jgi:hypothetical protein
MRSNDSMDDLIAFLALVAIVLTLLLAYYVVSAMLAFLIASYRYHKYQQAAQKSYQEIADEVGANFLPDDVLRALYGAGVKLAEEDGFDNWIDAIYMGTEVEYGNEQIA